MLAWRRERRSDRDPDDDWDDDWDDSFTDGLVPLALTTHALVRPSTLQYTTQKSKKNTPERIEMKKYNKYLRRHTLHREIK